MNMFPDWNSQSAFLQVSSSEDLSYRRCISRCSFWPSSVASGPSFHLKWSAVLRFSSACFCLWLDPNNGPPPLSPRWLMFGRLLPEGSRSSIVVEVHLHPRLPVERCLDLRLHPSSNQHSCRPILSSSPIAVSPPYQSWPNNWVLRENN